MKKKKHSIVHETVERTIRQVRCTQKGCKFYGKEAQQGVCFSNEGELVEFAKLDAHEKELLAELKVMKIREGKNYTRALEAYYISAMMNWQIGLDEVIRLRGENALLKAKAKRR